VGQPSSPSRRHASRGQEVVDRLVLRPVALGRRERVAQRPEAMAGDQGGQVEALRQARGLS
jgi:hypothetical protein